MQKPKLHQTIDSKESKPKNWFNLGIFLVSLIVVPFILLAFREIQDYRSSASPGTANLYIFPSQLTSRTGESKSVQVWLDPGGTPVTSVQLIMKYNPAIINITNITPGSFFTDAGVGSPLEMLKDISTPGTISYLVSFPLTQTIHASTTVAPVAEIFYTGTAEGVTGLSFEVANLPKTKVSGSDGVDALKTATEGQLSISTVGYLSMGPIQPANPQQLGQQFQADLLLDTGDQNVSAVDAKMTFNPASFQVVSITQDPASPFVSYQDKSFDNTAGTISVSANLGSGSGVAPVNGRAVKLATMVFRAANSASISSLNFSFTPGDRNDSNIVLYNVTQGAEAVDILGAVGPLWVVIGATTTVNPTGQPTVNPTGQPTVNPTAQPTVQPTAQPTAVPTVQPTAQPTAVPTVQPTAQPTVQPTATRTPTLVPTAGPTTIPTATPTLAPGQMYLTIAAQGRRRTDAIAPSFFKVTVTNTSGAVVGTFTSGSTTLSQSISLTPGNYIFLVESPGYLKRKFGTPSSPIQVASGSQNLNLTQYPLSGGDFNNDGIINEIDYSLLFLNKFSTNDSVVDIDGSGKVNNLDYDIMRSNWGRVSDNL